MSLAGLEAEIMIMIIIINKQVLARSENLVQRAKAQSMNMTKVGTLGGVSCEHRQDPRPVADPGLKLVHTKERQPWSGPGYRSGRPGSGFDGLGSES